LELTGYWRKQDEARSEAHCEFRRKQDEEFAEAQEIHSARLKKIREHNELLGMVCEMDMEGMEEILREWCCREKRTTQCAAAPPKPQAAMTLSESIDDLIARYQKPYLDFLHQ
jgi:hypothetical protein